MDGRDQGRAGGTCRNSSNSSSPFAWLSNLWRGGSSEHAAQGSGGGRSVASSLSPRWAAGLDTAARGGCVTAEKRLQGSSRAAVDRGAAVGGGRPGSAPLEEDAPVVGQPLDPRRQLQPQLQDLQQDHGIALQLAPPGVATVRQPLLRPSKRLLIESRWVSEPLAFAGELRPRRLNS
jgi:hypothetical protein